MEHIESTSRKETRFPSKYATNLASRRFTLLPHPHRPFASLKGIRKDFSTTVVDEIDRTSLESIFIGKNSTIFFFSMVYGLLGQRIENSVALYTHYVLIKYSYCFTNLPFWISSLYNSFLAKNRDSISLISKGKSILFTRCRVYLYNWKRKK